MAYVGPILTVMLNSVYHNGVVSLYEISVTILLKRNAADTFVDSSKRVFQ